MITHKEHPHCVYTGAGIDAQKMLESLGKTTGPVEFHAHPYSQACPGEFAKSPTVQQCWRDGGKNVR